ncbi:hypothetical protein PG991_006812 [Apiospora marii]|uniref:Uncharacterized protein n=1 Tax=Apiospora marii TaxID=335849 RepID=A0ABR1RYD2_9PEZI
MPYPMMGSSQSYWNNVPDFVGVGAATVPDDNTVSEAVGADDPSNKNKPRGAPPARRPRKKTQTPVDRERELNYALVAAHRNLTRMSQYLLKLQARADMATDEDMRLTLEATLENHQHSTRQDGSEEDEESPDGYHARLVEDVSRLSDQLWNRMYTLDRDIRYLSRQHRREEGNGGRSGRIQLRGESHTQHWLDAKLERLVSGLQGEETFFYTVRDLAAGRPLTEWMGYIRDGLQRVADAGGPGPVREDRVVAIAWSFLDRAIRPSRPRVSTTVNRFVAEWDSLRRGGAFDAALEEPERQVEIDAEVLESLRPIWAARHKPL